MHTLRIEVLGSQDDYTTHAIEIIELPKIHDKFPVSRISLIPTLLPKGEGLYISLPPGEGELARLECELRPMMGKSSRHRFNASSTFSAA